MSLYMVFVHHAVSPFFLCHVPEENNMASSTSISWEQNGHNTIVLCIVSDPHCEIENIHRLADLLVQKEISPDIVIVPGDIVSMSRNDQDDASICAAAVGEVSSMLGSVEQISGRVAYIPGNHDPKSMFQSMDADGPRMTPHSLNIHNRFLKIAPNLFLAGVGGSVPGLYEDGSEAWLGYPYGSEADYADVLEPFLRLNLSKLEENDKLLLVTHIGPDPLSTGVDTSGTKPIHSGSTLLMKMFKEQLFQEHVLLNIHGHTHESTGMGQVGQITVVNPGSLKYGARYAIITLKMGVASSVWKVSSVEFSNLFD
jgi:Icc-related predicted phosphoesterase